MRRDQELGLFSLEHRWLQGILDLMGGKAKTMEPDSVDSSGHGDRTN